MSNISFVLASSPTWLPLQLLPSQLSFSCVMVFHTARSKLSQQRYGIVEFILVHIDDRSAASMRRIYHVPVSFEMMPVSHILMLIDHHDH
jgi:hypothetical protein